MEFSLQLRHSNSRQRDTTAILIPGDDVSQWLSVLERSGVPSSQCQFLMIHEDRQATIQTVGTVCVFPPGYRPESAMSLAGHEYGCIVDRVFLPVEARLYPEATDEELDRLLPTDSSRLFVWHPTAGLIGFEPDHVLRVSDLLASPKSSNTVWRDLGTDQQINRTIHSLAPEANPDVDEILNTGQDDIGTESENLADAPRAPDEKSAEGLRDGIKALKQGIANGVFKLTSKLKTSENGNRTLSRLHNWAANLISSANDATADSNTGRKRKLPDAGISTRRENEIKRLLNLLQNDPDNGLKFALPMADGNSGRGIADATDRLTPQDMNFDPASMYESGPADPWDIPWEYQIRLIQQYRQLAQREQRLGRYRRAAYIYARLLHDLPASAAALEAGKYYHEAAAIYVEHLHNPSAAANCLRIGGFWEEAVQIYKNRELWVEAGELYEELGQRDASRQMFENAIRDEETKRNYVAAADIADNRLNDPEQASGLFVTGWMQANKGKQCLQDLLSMLGRRGLHDEAEQTLRQATDTNYLGLDQIQDALEVCVHNAENYPDEAIRDSSRKQCWRLAADLLKRDDEFSASDHKVALAAVGNLAKKDRLLQTDSQRFLIQHQESNHSNTQPAPSIVRQQRVPTAKLIGRYLLNPEGTEAETTWSQIVCNGSFLFRVGCHYQVILARQAIGVRRDGRLSTQDEVVRVTRPEHFSYQELKLKLDSDNPDQAWVFTANSAFWQTHESAMTDIQESTFFCTPPVTDGHILDVYGAANGRFFSTVMCPDVDEPRFEFRAVNCLNFMEHATNIDVSLRDIIYPDTLTQLTHHDGKFFAVFGQKVLEIHADTEELTIGNPNSKFRIREVEVLPFAPHEVVCSPSATAARLAFSFTSGVRAIWPGQQLGCAFAEDLSTPRLTFTTNGILAAACRETHRIEYWRLNSGDAILHADYQLDDAITHLTCGPAPNQVLAFHSDGSMSQISIPTS